MRNIKELFVPYEIAVKAKEKGFNELCIGAYYQKNNSNEKVTFEPDTDKNPTNNYTHYFDGVRNSDTKDSFAIYEMVTAPLYQQLVDWLRERCSTRMRITEELGKGTFGMYCFSVRSEYPTILAEGKTYYEALNKALEEALKLI